MSSYPGDERSAAQQAEQRARRASTLSDEQLARLVNIADADTEHVFEMEDYHALELALRELQQRRAQAPRFSCFICDDGHTALHCLNCARKLLNAEAAQGNGA